MRSLRFKKHQMGRYLGIDLQLKLLRRVNVRLVIEVIGLTTLLISVIAGSYLRYYPVINALKYGYGPTLYEMDPFLNYWITKILHEKGLTYYTELIRDNNLTKIFWYPLGRDIPTTELPALPYVSLITYYMASIVNPNLSLYEWLVYLPILFYVIGVIGIYLTIRELTNPIAAGIAVLTASLMFIDRLIAGFTVKYGLGLAFIFLATYFHVRAIKRDSRYSALVCGVLLGITALSWAGFNLLMAAMLTQYVLIPLLSSNVRKYLTLWLYEVIPLTMFIVLAPSYYEGLKYLIYNAGVMIPIGTLAIVCGLLLHSIASSKYVRVRKIPLLNKPRLMYFMVLTFFGIVGVMALVTGFVGIGGKGLAAMGLGHLAGVLTGTIAQYRSATPSEFIQWGGMPLIVSVVGSFYLLYKGFIRKDPIAVFLLALNIIALMATANVAYFFSFSNLVVALVASYVVGDTFLHRLVYVNPKSKLSWFSKILIVVITILYVTAVILHGVSLWIPAHASVVPTVIESGTGLSMNIPSWINMLNWIRNNTEEDAVIVAWWDYGYWISVIGERASVADGSTLNFTQINLLAKALTSDELTAADILVKNFMIPPSKLYVATYEFFIVDDYNKRVYPGPLVLSRGDGTPIFIGADGAKGMSAMFRIAGVDIDREVDRGGGEYVKIYSITIGNHIYRYVLPNWNSDKVKNALIYKIMLNGAYTIWGSLGYSIYDAFVSGSSPVEIGVNPMQIFKPVYMSASRITSNIYLVTFLYKLDYNLIH